MLTEHLYNELKKYKSECHTGPTATTEIRFLRDQNYIRPASWKLKGSSDEYSTNPTAWVITPAGEEALSEFESARDKNAEDKIEKRFNHKIAVLNLLVPLITFVAGVLVEHFYSVADFAVSLAELVISFFH